MADVTAAPVLTKKSRLVPSVPRRRYTQEDIHSIPLHILKKAKNVDIFLDDEGFLLPLFANIIDRVKARFSFREIGRQN